MSLQVNALDQFLERAFALPPDVVIAKLDALLRNSPYYQGRKEEEIEDEVLVA